MFKKKISLFTKSILYCLITAIISFLFIFIMSKYCEASAIDITTILNGNTSSGIFASCYNLIINVFGVNNLIASFVGGWFAIWFILLIVGAVCVLASFLIYWLARVIMSVANR